MLDEQMMHAGPMWVLAGLGAGWLAETFMSRRGYGLIVDMSLGVGASLVGSSVVLALSGLPAGMLGMLVAGFVVAVSAILAQRLGWPCTSGARERRARLRLVELGRPSLGGEGTAAARLGSGDATGGRPVPTRALVRMATTGIYLLRGVPLELQRAARGRAVSEGTTLRQVLLKGLGEYAAGSWTPRPDDTPPVALDPGLHATGR
jgi:uncharacterized membrane protein YeaQ/YmgE (transglycosylase-associated protein family)